MAYLETASGKPTCDLDAPETFDDDSADNNETITATYDNSIELIKDRVNHVCTGVFTKEARYEADRTSVPIRLLDLDSFVRNYVEVYDKVNDIDHAILPLTRIWMPA